MTSEIELQAVLNRCTPITLIAMSEADKFQQEATPYVAQLWDGVFHTSNVVITNSKLYGFVGIQLIENPNIRQLLASMSVVSTMLDKIMEAASSPNTPDVGHDNMRMLLNARKQVAQLEAVAVALAANDEALYNEEVEKLELQAAI